MATDDKPHLYKHGLPFSECLAENLKDLNQRVKNKKASLILVDGGVGEGKTTLMVEIADYINSLHGHPVIEIEVKNKKAGPQLSMGGSDFLKKLHECHEKQLVCIIYDEAGDFTKRGSLTKFNAMLNRTFDTFRGYRILVILGLPNFNILDNNLFDNQIPRLLLHCHSRTIRSGSFSGYGLDEMNWIRFWMGKWPKHRTKAYNNVTPNFRGHFLDISPKRSEELDTVSTTSKLSILKKSAVKIEGLLSYPEMATKLNRSVGWTRTAVNNLKIKPSRVIDRAKYFDSDVLNQLSEHLDNTAPIGRPKET